MKEFALKHPILTFLLVDSAIGGVVKLIYALTGYHDKCEVVETEPEDSEKSVAVDEDKEETV